MRKYQCPNANVQTPMPNCTPYFIRFVLQCTPLHSTIAIHYTAQPIRSTYLMAFFQQLWCFVAANANANAMVVVMVVVCMWCGAQMLFAPAHGHFDGPFPILALLCCHFGVVTIPCLRGWLPRDRVCANRHVTGDHRLQRFSPE